MKNNTNKNKFSVWSTIIVILGFILFITGAFISKFNPTLLSNGTHITDASRIYVDYMFSRNLAISFFLLFLLIIKARKVLACFMLFTSLIQFIDFFDDIMRGASMLAFGILILTIILFIGSNLILEGPVWKHESWETENTAMTTHEKE